MTKRVLPRLEDQVLPWRVARPRPEVVLLVPAGPPSETVAFELLVRFVTDAEARRLQKDFAHQVIEPRRRQRLMAVPPSRAIDELAADMVTGWLEATWLAEADGARGIPRPERWKPVSR